MSAEELAPLQCAGSPPSVHLLLTERSAMERVPDHVVQGNTVQMADAALDR